MDLQAAISSIMSTDLKTAKASDPVAVVNEYFNEFRIHHVPVIDEENEVVGIISKSDFLYLLRGYTVSDVDTYLREAKLRSFKVEEIMSKDVVTLSASGSIKDAVGILSENRFRCLPILDDNNHLVGIVTPNDILHFINQEIG